MDLMDKDSSENEASEQEPKRRKVMIEADAEKRQMDVIFIGDHAAGKSTTCGFMLHGDKYRGMDVSDIRTDLNTLMDYCMDEQKLNLTVEVGREDYTTKRTRFSFLDAPGHQRYVQEMIRGASVADVGVLVISAQNGEFQRVFEIGGQTHEHVQLAIALGVNKLIVVVNKMDTVNWSIDRYKEIESRMTPVLNSSGYNVKRDVQFLPISGLRGSNLLWRVSSDVCDWWNGAYLLEALEAIGVPPCRPEAQFRLSIMDTIIDGDDTFYRGKVLSGTIRVHDEMVIMPYQIQVRIQHLRTSTWESVQLAGHGEYIGISVHDIPDIPPPELLCGSVFCSIENRIPAITSFFARLTFLEVLGNPIYAVGYKAKLYIHAVEEDCEIVQMMREDYQNEVYVRKGATVLCRIQVDHPIYIERFHDCPRLGSFALRYGGKTVACGKVLDPIRMS